MRFRVTLVLASVLATPTIVFADKPLPARELSARIDSLIVARWKQHKVTSAPSATDAEWVRRTHLDLVGRIPDILATRDFIDDPARDKHEKLIDALLVADRYAFHWAAVWRGWWLAQNAAEMQAQNLGFGFEGWLHGRLKKNVRYDVLVSEVLTGTRSGYTDPSGFITAVRSRPEEIASVASRSFMGVKLECAQCHDHPFAKWKRQQFWEFAAFFSEIGAPQVDPENQQVIRRSPTPGEISIPGTDKVAKATFPGTKEPVKFNGSTRAALAEWLTAKDNPYFARAAVNRVWEYLLGTGLIEPVDEESEDNPPSHPELLNLLAEQFALSGFDLKYLIKAICLSDVYRLTSKQTHESQTDARLFARMRVRGISPEQFWDSLALATGQRDEDHGFDQYGRAYNYNAPRFDFLRRFPNQEKRTEQQTSILQALYLMNGKLVADATSLEHNENLRVLAEAKKTPTPRRVEQLYLVVLSRKPTTAESARLVKYIDAGGPKKDPRRALCDVFWALLNSSEFCTNH